MTLGDGSVPPLRWAISKRVPWVVRRHDCSIDGGVIVGAFDSGCAKVPSTLQSPIRHDDLEEDAGEVRHALLSPTLAQQQVQLSRNDEKNKFLNIQRTLVFGVMKWVLENPARADITGEPQTPQSLILTPEKLARDYPQHEPQHGSTLRHAFGPNTAAARKASPECPRLSDIQVRVPTSFH